MSSQIEGYMGGDGPLSDPNGSVQTTVLVVEDDSFLRGALSEILVAAGFNVLEAEQGEQALAILSAQPVDAVVSDVQMPKIDGHGLLDRVQCLWPGLPFVLMTAYGEVSRAVNAIQQGAIDYLVKPCEASALIQLIEHAVGKRTGAYIADDPRSRELLAFAQRVAVSDANVMITGDSGAGKEVIARMIHEHSNRRQAPYVAINCAAIPESMLEAVLFGHEKGAFTGATQAQKGKFELANGGTLLLDEISEMDLSLQSKLLRVLQEKEVERLGSHTLIDLDVRILATSNRNLADEVFAGRFREDLYYRLNVLPLHVPPLRERPGDIVPLAEHFLEKYAGGKIPEFDAGAKDRLRQYPWPGNVRELENVVQRALVMQPGARITDAALRFSPAPGSGPDHTVPASVMAAEADLRGEDLKGNEQNLILEVLKQAGGNRKETAERLGISPRTLRYKLAKFKDMGVEVP